jgi:hypothetical protein
MAKDPDATGLPLTRNRVVLLQNLTRAITAALLEDNLDRATELLEHRWLALQRLDWNSPADEELQTELQKLYELDQSLLTYCRTWRDTVEERLHTLTACHNLRLRYCPPPVAARFVDLRK